MKYSRRPAAGAVRTVDTAHAPRTGQEQVQDYPVAQALSTLRDRPEAGPTHRYKLQVPAVLPILDRPEAGATHLYELQVPELLPKLDRPEVGATHPCKLQVPAVLPILDRPEAGATHPCKLQVPAVLPILDRPEAGATHLYELQVPELLPNRDLPEAGPTRILKLALFAGILLATATYARLPEWISSIEAGNRLEAVFFRNMNLPAGPISARRPPKETRVELTNLINQAPTEADLYSLRAHEEEALLDFAAAEADWKKYAELARDKAVGSLALADYYHRQLKVREELAALGNAASQPSPSTERFASAPEQRSWKLFQRMLLLADRQLLPRDAREAIYRQWRDRYPAEMEPMRAWIGYLISEKLYEPAQTLAADYAERFPADSAFALKTRADMERSLGGVARAAALYEKEFQTLWPATLTAEAFAAFRDARYSRQFLMNARAAASANPLSVDPAARIFHFYLQEGNAGAAQRALSDFARRKEATPNSWKPAELLTVARLYDEYAQQTNDAARYYYALYSIAGASAGDQESALAAIATMLLVQPDKMASLGAGSLALYRDIATADPYPGYLNGILSLLLNSSDPQYRFSEQERQSAPYFRRARASELVDLFERRFPNSTRRATLRAQVVQAFALHGDSDAVITSGRQFLTTFPSDGSRTHVSLLLADALARKAQVPAELAVYDGLLAELAKKAEGVPLGEGVVVAGSPDKRKGPRSPEYARVLDRYISRLVALKRPKDGLVVLRRELDRNPDDPGLYERLALFLDQNKLATEIEAVYKRAISHFADRSWQHKLARFYLRQKQTAAFRQLTAEVTKIFAGSELERYFADVVAQSGADAQMLRQVNLAANQRFPHNLTFVKNLLSVYERKETLNTVEWERLLRQHWFGDEQLRARFFEYLSRTGKLRAEIQALRGANQAGNSAATRMLGEAEVWRAHFEDAAPSLLALTKDTPGETAFGERTASLYRSLAAYDFRRAVDAIGIETSLAKAAPRDTGAVTRIGEIYADTDRFGLAKPQWLRIAEIEPGAGEGYLEAATVFWDYYQYDDALRLIDQGRRRLTNASLYAYEAGAVHENKRDYEKAVAEYVKGALAQPGGSPAQARLMDLARRPSLRTAIDNATARLVQGDAPDLNAVTLRVALLEAQQRKGDIEALLLNLADRAQSFEVLSRMEDEGRRLAMANVQERSLVRQIALTQDPVDKLRMRVTLARHYEDQRNPAAASKTIDALVRENPRTLGVVRTAVNYYWRNRNVSRTLDLLNNAATAAHPELKPQLQFEAARKATEGAQYATARGILQESLKDKPLDASLIGAMADTYAREGDDRALRAYYEARIGELPKDRAAALRRALVPVLTRMKDHAGAVDQYIEVLNRYPEDAVLADEMAAYARQYQQQGKLLAYYQKTITASPRDARFHVVVARLQAAFEDYPASIAAYSKAIELRPDRLDLLSSRGDMEERLLRFDDAATTFARVYDLSYRNSTWMERVAEIRARQRKTEDCLTALRKAFLDGRESSPAGWFAAAAKLDGWGMLPQAREFAEKGVQLAGDKLAEDYWYGASTYARIMTKLGQFDAAFAKAPAALASMAEVVTPEQRPQFAAFLDRMKPPAPPEIGQKAGLADWEAKRLVQLLTADSAGDAAGSYLNRLVDLQKRRLAFTDLGAQLEAYAKLRQPENGPGVREMAADAYRQAGDEVAELRVLLATNNQSERYLELLSRRNTARLLQLAAVGPRDEAVMAAFASGNSALTLQAIAARGEGLPAVWNRSYLALGGLYFGLRTPNINQAFQAALGSLLIGDRIGKPLDRTQQLAGDTWFYYGGRYAEYLDLLKNKDAEDYLGSIVEQTPGRASAYLQLADYERESGRAASALRDYGLVLQLDNRHSSALIRRGLVLAAQGNLEGAKQSWREALEAIDVRMKAARPPSNLPDDLTTLLDELASRKLLAEMREPVERCIAGYVSRYGTFGVRGILRHFDGPSILAMSRNVSRSSDFLNALVDEPWLAAGDRTVFLERILELMNAQTTSAVGDARGNLINQTSEVAIKYVDHLLDSKQTARARTALAGLSEELRQRMSWKLPQYELQFAEQEGKLAALLDNWRADQSQAPPNLDVQSVAATLREKGSAASARLLLRYYYSRELQQPAPAAPYFLGLAEVLLEDNDVSGAMSVLRRMNLVTQPAFANLGHATKLLRRFNREAEAKEFADIQAKAVPWSIEPAAPPAATTFAAALAAVRANPDDMLRKVQLFRLANAGNQHRVAVQAIQALAERGGARMLFEDFRGDYRPDRYVAEQFLAEQSLTTPERAKLARDAADSLDRIGRLQAAIATRQVAELIAPSADGNAWIAARHREADRRRINLERIPKISENLQQDHLVRPMIAAGGAR